MKPYPLTTIAHLYFMNDTLRQNQEQTGYMKALLCRKHKNIRGNHGLPPPLYF